MRRTKMVALATAIAIPMVWSATLSENTRTEIINRSLSALLLGVLPLLGAMLLWQQDFQEADVDVRYGANRRMLVARKLLATFIPLMTFALGSVALTIALERGPRDPLLLRDLLATLPIALAAALSVGAVLALGGSFLGRFGLAVLLLLLWVFGSLDGPVAMALPSGHVRGLLGLGDPLPLPAWGSFLSLYGFALAASGGLVARTPR